MGLDPACGISSEGKLGNLLALNIDVDVVAQDLHVAAKYEKRLFALRMIDRNKSKIISVVRLAIVYEHISQPAGNGSFPGSTYMNIPAVLSQKQHTR